MKKILYMKCSLCFKTISAAVFGVCLLAGCEADYNVGKPWGGDISYVNFYNAMEVAYYLSLEQYPDITGVDNTLYVNDPVKTDSLSRLLTFPLADNETGNLRQTPSGLPYMWTHENGGGSGTVFWLPLKSGQYRFIYTSHKNCYLKDTTAVLKKDNFTSFFLSESATSDSTYRVIGMPADFTHEKGKVSLRVINLSPDIGPVDAYITNKNGEEISSGLLNNIASGSYSVRVPVDTTLENKGKIIVSFRKHGATEAFYSQSVDALSASSYLLVIQGFETPVYRELKTGVGQYLTVYVGGNLRVNAVRIY